METSQQANLQRLHELLQQKQANAANQEVNSDVAVRQELDNMNKDEQILTAKLAKAHGVQHTFRPWKLDEHKRFVEAVRASGKDLQAIKAAVKTRTVDDVKRRFTLFTSKYAAQSAHNQRSASKPITAGTAFAVGRTMNAKAEWGASKKVKGSYDVAATLDVEWTHEEQQRLEEGLTRFPMVQGGDNFMSYVKIAYGLKDKSVLDVAQRVRWMEGLTQDLNVGVMPETKPATTTGTTRVTGKQKLPPGSQESSRKLLKKESGSPAAAGAKARQLSAEEHEANRILADSDELLKKLAENLESVKGVEDTEKMAEKFRDNMEVMIRLRCNLAQTVQTVSSIPSQANLPSIPIKVMSLKNTEGPTSTTTII